MKHYTSIQTRTTSPISHLQDQLIKFEREENKACHKQIKSFLQMESYAN